MIIDDQVAYEGIKLAYDGEYEKAIEKFEDFLRREPKQIQMMGELCNCYYETKRYEDLEKLARKALLLSQNIANTDNIGRFYGYIGKSFLQRENYEEGARYFRLAIANKEHFIPNYHELAYCLFYLEKYEEATELFSKIEDMNPDYAKDYEIEKKKQIVFDEWTQKSPARYLSVSGFQAEQENNYNLAKLEYNKCLKLEPNNLMALYGLFKIAREQNLTLKAIELGKKLVELLNKFENKKEYFFKPPVYIGLSMEYNKLDDFETSAEYGQWFATTEYMSQAKKAIERGEFDEALERYSEAFETRPDSFDVIDRIIDFYYLTNKISEIGEFLNKGLNLAMEKYDNERVADYCYKFAKYFVKDKNVEQAHKYCEMAANTSKDIDFKLKVKYYCGTMLYMVKKDSEALKYFEECEVLIANGATDKYDVPSAIIKMKNLLDENSDMSRAEKLFITGKELRKQEKYEDAIGALNASLQLRPQVIDVMWELAYCYAVLSKKSESSEVAEEGYKVSIQSGDVRYAETFAYNVALYNFHIKNYAKSLKYINNALQYNPENDDYITIKNACEALL